MSASGGGGGGEGGGKNACSCTSPRLRCSAVFITILGLGLIGCAQWLPPYVQTLLDQGVINQITLTEAGQRAGNDDTWNGFISNGPERGDDASAEWYRVTFWNVTNPAQYLAGTQKPKLVEVGPFTYRDVQKKFDFTWGFDPDRRKTLSYKTFEYWLFDKSRSCAICDPDNLVITTLNLPFFGVANAIAKLGNDDLLPIIYGWFPEQERFFTRRTANQLLWGYHDPVLDTISKIANVTMPFYGVFGPNQTKPNHDASPDTIYTGEDYPELVRTYAKFREMPYMRCDNRSAWKTPRANRVTGTDGTQYHAGVRKGESLPTWVSALFRSATIQNINNETATWKGMDLLRFRIPPSLMANSTANPDNDDYYMTGPSGAMDISRCEDVPVFMTKPHFLGVSSLVVDLVEGMSPDPLIHDTYVDVEPVTGIVMNVMRRLQVTLHLGPLHVWFNNTWFPHIHTDTLFPVLWLGDGGEATDKQATTFKSGVYFARDVIYYVTWVGYILGNIFALIGILFFTCAANRKDEDGDERTKPLMTHVGE